MPDTLLALIEHSLDFTVHAAAATPVSNPHSTGWRILPELVVALPSEGGRVRLEIDGGPSPQVGDGDAFCVRGGIRHCATLITPRGVSRWAHVAYRTLGGLDPLSLLEPAYVIPAPDGRRAGQICVELAALPAAPVSLLAASRRRALGFELLALVVAQSPPTPVATARVQAIQRLAPGLDLIERELAHGGPSVPEVARAAGVSRSRLHALFRLALGVAPLQHILAYRLRRAQHLLIGSDLAIAEVAARTGFGDAFHFSRSFRHAVGESPSAYRARGLGASA